MSNADCAVGTPEQVGVGPFHQARTRYCASPGPRVKFEQTMIAVQIPARLIRL